MGWGSGFGGLGSFGGVWVRCGGWWGWVGVFLFLVFVRPRCSPRVLRLDTLRWVLGLACNLVSCGPMGERISHWLASGALPFDLAGAGAFLVEGGGTIAWFPVGFAHSILVMLTLPLGFSLSLSYFCLYYVTLTGAGLGFGVAWSLGRLFPLEFGAVKLTYPAWCYGVGRDDAAAAGLAGLSGKWSERARLWTFRNSAAMRFGGLELVPGFLSTRLPRHNTKLDTLA